MKFIGHTNSGCQCVQCIGPNGSKPTRKALKHGGRQKLKKEVRDAKRLIKEEK